MSNKVRPIPPNWTHAQQTVVGASSHDIQLASDTIFNALDVNKLNNQVDKLDMYWIC